MIYNNYTIRASVADWNYYDVTEDGALGKFRGNGGIDADSAEYEIYKVSGDDDEPIDGGYSTIEAAKRAIDAMETK